MGGLALGGRHANEHDGFAAPSSSACSIRKSHCNARALRPATVTQRRREPKASPWGPVTATADRSPTRQRTRDAEERGVWLSPGAYGRGPAGSACPTGRVLNSARSRARRASGVG